MTVLADLSHEAGDLDIGARASAREIAYRKLHPRAQGRAAIDVAFDLKRKLGDKTVPEKDPKTSPGKASTTTEDDDFTSIYVALDYLTGANGTPKNEPAVNEAAVNEAAVNEAAVDTADGKVKADATIKKIRKVLETDSAKITGPNPHQFDILSALRLKLARLLAARGRVDEALAEYQKLLDDLNQFVAMDDWRLQEARRGMAETYFNQGDLQRASDWFMQIIQTGDHAGHSDSRSVQSAAAKWIDVERRLGHGATGAVDASALSNEKNEAEKASGGNPAALSADAAAALNFQLQKLSAGIRRLLLSGLGFSGDTVKPTVAIVDRQTKTGTDGKPEGRVQPAVDYDSKLQKAADLQKQCGALLDALGLRKSALSDMESDAQCDPVKLEAARRDLAALYRVLGDTPSAIKLEINFTRNK